jgi:hypothetical protein
MVIISAKAAAALTCRVARSNDGERPKGERGGSGGAEEEELRKKAPAPAAEERRRRVLPCGRAVFKIWAARSLLWTAWTKRLLLYFVDR